MHAGTVERVPAVVSPQLGNARDLLVYLPPSYATAPDRRYPVLYLQDGQNVFDPGTSYSHQEWGADEAAEALARDGREAILVGIPNMGLDRLAEYGPFPSAEAGWEARGEAYAAFVIETVKPLVDARFRTLPDRAHTGMVGSSAGGVIGLYIALRYPMEVGFVGALSPAFFLGGGFVMPWLQANPAPGLRVWLDMGALEGGDMLNRSRFVANLLSDQGADVRYLVDPEGAHDEASWRDRFPEVLRWFLEDPEPRLEPAAATMLDTARRAAGGPALAAMRRLEVRFQSTSYSQTGERAVPGDPIDTRLLADLGARVVRMEYLVNRRPVMILQADDAGGWQWTADGGTRPLPRDQNDGLLLNLDTGPIGLVLGSGGRDAARLLGPTAIAGIEGDGVMVSTHGAVTTYVFAPDGTLLAERALVPGGLPQANRYMNPRAIDGLSFPFAIDQSVGGALVGSIRLTSLNANPTWPEDAFARP